MKARDWRGLPHYAAWYKPWQRRALIAMDRGIIRLAKFTFCLVLASPFLHELRGML